ncbi:MAG: hypothetical protein HC840_24540 [Leptolyngbyaceae cyanobacterium RM2_2_4]|nr:hypothetical protein [Leptolyngbyaceae cyanobacterium SM1_4_3]NJO52050.1 hypothetical protein [Leptolyngbyaceae cyanobacterium RM2_2_4]
MARSLSYKAVSAVQAIAITAAIAIISGQIQLDFTTISEALSKFIVPHSHSSLR